MMSLYIITLHCFQNPKTLFFKFKLTVSDNIQYRLHILLYTRRTYICKVLVLLHCIAVSALISTYQYTYF